MLWKKRKRIMKNTGDNVEKQLIQNYNLIKKKPYVGYSYCLYLFIEKLYNVCKEEKIENLFFLSREGEFLKKLFDCYLTLNNDNSIRTFYLYTSRISSFVASLRPLEEENFDILFSSYPDMSIEKFLINCGFEKEDIKSIQKTMTQDISCTINNIKESYEFQHIKENSLFIKLYEKKRQEQKRCFEQYLKSFNVDFLQKGLHIVDVGWKGTIQDNLFRFFEGRVIVNGYYMGLNGENGIRNDEYKKGLLFSNINSYSPYFDIFFYDYTFLERLLFASHGSVIRYSCRDNKYIPITHFYQHELENWHMISPIQDEIYENFKRLFLIFSTNCSYAKSYDYIISELHCKTVILFSKSEKNIQNNMLQNHIENFGIWKYTKKLKFMPSIDTFKYKMLQFDTKSRNFLFTIYLNVLLVLRQHNLLYRFFVLFNPILITVYLRKQKRLKYEEDNKK